MFLAITITGCILYSEPNRGNEWSKNKPEPFIIDVTIGNLGESESNYNSTEVNVMVLLNSLMILAIFIMYLIFRPYQVRIIKKVDEINVTAGDFTVMVSNLPKDKTKEQISEWILSHIEGADIKDISL